jgi:hypothetical protein
MNIVIDLFDTESSISKKANSKSKDKIVIKERAPSVKKTSLHKSVSKDSANIKNQ